MFMKLFIKEIERTKTYFNEDRITYYLIDENSMVLKSCVASSPEWAKHLLVDEDTRYNNGSFEIEFMGRNM